MGSEFLQSTVWLPTAPALYDAALPAAATCQRLLLLAMTAKPSPPEEGCSFSNGVVGSALHRENAHERAILNLRSKCQPQK